MAEKDKLIPWIHTKLLAIDGSNLADATFEYKDDIDLSRTRFFNLKDDEFLMLQIAMTTVALLYGQKPVAEAEHNGETTEITGDDLIEFLNEMNEKRSGTGTFVKSDELISILIQMVKLIKSKSSVKKPRSKTVKGAAKAAWRHACDSIEACLKAFQENM